MVRDNVNAAIQVLHKIRKAAAKIPAMPNRGRIVPDLKEFGLRIYREILAPPWRTIYQVSDPKVYVMAVIDSRRNVEDILLDRLIR